MGGGGAHSCHEGLQQFQPIIEAGEGPLCFLQVMEVLGRLSEVETVRLQDLAQRGLAQAGTGAGEGDGGARAAAGAGASAHAVAGGTHTGAMDAGGEGIVASTSGDVDAPGMGDMAAEAQADNVYATHGLFEESIRWGWSWGVLRVPQRAGAGGRRDARPPARQAHSGMRGRLHGGLTPA